MTTLENRPGTALLVIDVQNGVVGAAHDRDQIVATIARVADRARSAGVPVVWIQHNSDELPKDTEPWQFVPELARDDAEPLIQKFHGDSFEGTDLEEVLAGLGVGHVFLAGAQTDACIRSTLHGAFTRGYDTTLIADAHTTEDLSAYGAPSPDKVIAHTNMYWTYQTAPGRTAGTVTADDLDFKA